MLFFDDKLLLKYSGVTGGILDLDRAGTALNAASDAARAARAARDANSDNRYAGRYARAAYDAGRDDRDAYAAYAAVREHFDVLKPFKSLSETALSALSIVFAPLLLTLLALDEMLSFVVSSLKSIVDLCTSGTDEAKKSGAEAVSHLLNAFKALLAAAVSPVVNTVDFVGSCVTTLTEADENTLGYNA